MVIYSIGTDLGEMFLCTNFAKPLNLSREGQAGALYRGHVLVLRWEFIKENKKVRKQENTQESDQEKKRENTFDQESGQEKAVTVKKKKKKETRSRPRKKRKPFFLFLPFLFSFINSHLW